MHNKGGDFLVELVMVGRRVSAYTGSHVNQAQLRLGQTDRFTGNRMIRRLDMELLLALGGFAALFTMWVVAPKFLVKKSE